MRILKNTLLCFALLLLAAASTVHAQGVLSKRPNVYINSNCNGYLEYLPNGYSTSGQNYPLIVYINGIGSTGDGSEAALENEFTGGGYPHEQQRAGTWPDAFTVNGQTFQFLIITPQFRDPMDQHIPTPSEIQDVINYSVQHYRVDATRIYLMGQSQGGGPVWDYPGASSANANRLAAIIPFAGVSFPFEEKANIIKNSGLAVWAFHNDYDNLVPSSFTKDYIAFINAAPAPVIPAKGTIFNASGHLCWYDPLMRNYTEGGLNVYQWLLQYKRTLTKAFAGNDQEIALPQTSVQLSGSGTGPNGSAVSYSWQKISGPSAGSVSGSGTTATASNLTSGTYVFRLTITDNSGASNYDDVAITVHPQRTRYEAENYSAMSGIQTTSTTDDGGGQVVGYIDQGDWMAYNINVPTAGTYKFRFRVGSFLSGAQFAVKNASGTVLQTVDVYYTGSWDKYFTITKNITLPAGAQTIRLESLNSQGWNINWFEIEGTSGTTPPPNVAPTANAGANQTITLPTSTVTLNGSGSDPDGTITAYSWTKVSGPSGGNFSSPSTASTTVSGLVQGTYVFRLTVTDNAGATGSSDVTITVNAANQPPTVSAGTNQTITLPTNSVTLSGTASDPDGSISSYAWTKASGPAGESITTPSSASTGVTGLVQGTYVFRLTARDNAGATAYSDVTITVNGATPANQNPVANAGSDKSITLPTNSVQLNGSATDPDGSIASYSWTQVSGPSQAGISPQGAAVTTVSNLVQGSYTFRLTATDNNGATASDDVVVTVNAAPVSGTVHIEAENYSAMSGIQTESTSDAGGGRNVGWIDNGDWVDYPINPATTGIYTFSFRVATPQGGAQLQVRTAAGTVLATVNIPNTGGWQSWQTATANVNLTAGAQTIRLVSTAPDNWNINWWEYKEGGTTPPPPPASGKIEAESYTAMNGVQTESTSDAGGGLNVGYIDLNDWMDYVVAPTESGNYTINFRVASQQSGAQFQLRTSTGAVLATVSVPNTGGWQSWQTVPATVTLSAGQQTLRIVSTAGAGWNINWLELTTGTITPPPATGRIEAENYTGMLGVQTEGTADAGGGLNVGWIDYNDWMDYSVGISTAGAYTLSFRVATPQNGAQFQVRTTGGSVLATVNVPNTGGWQSWQTITATVSLPAGQQTLRLLSTAGAGWNINWLELAAGTTPPPTTSLKIEAENYTVQTGTQTEGTSDAGGGQNVGYIDLGDWMDYSVSVPATGSYTVNFRVASQQSGGQFQLRKTDGTVLATVGVPNTGGWQAWQTITATVSLGAGQQTLRIVSTSSANWNINWFELIPPATPATSTKRSIEVDVNNSTVGSLAIYPNPVQEQFTLKMDNEYSGTVNVQVIDMHGAVRKTFSLQKAKGAAQIPLSVPSLASGEYLLRVQTKGGTQTVKLIKL